MYENNEVAQAPHPALNLTQEIHSVLDAISKRCDIITRHELPVSGSSLGLEKIASPATPIEIELRSVLDHARSILNRI